MQLGIGIERIAEHGHGGLLAVNRFSYPLSLREVRRRLRGCPVDIHAAERARVKFVRPGGNNGVREKQIEDSLRHPFSPRDDCMDAGGRAMPGAIAERAGVRAAPSK
jgi:hypothetical protein